MKKQIQETRLKVFIENARVLPESEISGLSQKKREAVSGKTGLWLEVECPEGACSLEKNTITLPAGGVIPNETKGLWLNLFCPENQCEVLEGSQVP
ncbi:MAG TPA: hypothetical protein VK885_13380 [Desulfotignum sp.]|jgi:hypothetical protein|nr:hypothetical protein [Desulfotignum sp.]